MSGAIGIACAETGRYSIFSECLANLAKPEGTNIYFAVGSDREKGRDALVEQMLANNDNWLLFLDDDQVFQSDLLIKLLAHKVDVVGALYLRRDKYFSPVAYEVSEDWSNFLPIDLKSFPSRGLVRVSAVGTGGMLIQRHVFESIESPWFPKETRTEDLVFCEKVSKWYDIYCDLGTCMGHMTTTAVWPDLRDGKWTVNFNIADQVTFWTER